MEQRDGARDGGSSLARCGHIADERPWAPADGAPVACPHGSGNLRLELDGGHIMGFLAKVVLVGRTFDDLKHRWLLIEAAARSRPVSDEIRPPLLAVLKSVRSACPERPDTDRVPLGL
jgi:hypothetical protein